MPEDMTKLCERIATLEEAAKSMEKRLDKQDEVVTTVLALAKSTEQLAQGLKETNENIRQMRRDVDDLRLKPGKRWDAIIASAISGSVAAAIAYFFGKTKGG